MPSNFILFGDDGEEATPVPMPNTEVKLFSADGSWGFPPVRVGHCQVKEEEKISRDTGLFLFLKKRLPKPKVFLKDVETMYKASQWSNKLRE